MSLSNFGEQFAAKTLRMFYQTAITPAVTNTNYEGEIRKAGDRVNILSFLSDITLGDYAANTDMNVEAIVDDEDQLIVEKRKYYNFPIDRLEDLFTYADDIDDTLVENANKVLERSIDSYVLENVQFAKAGSWIGIDMRITGSAGDTQASITTTAAGGTLNTQSGPVNGGTVATVEHGDGSLDYSGFEDPQDIGKPVRLTSGTTWATEWYRITAVTDSNTATITNWDAATAGSDIPAGDILRGLGGGSEFTSSQNTDGKVTSEAGWGWELQAVRATTIASGTVYEQITELAEKLDRNEIPDSDRHVTGTPVFTKILKQAAELQPAIEMAYTGVILNGHVGRVGGFMVHQAAGTRVSTRLEKSTASGQGADVSLSDGTRATMVLGNHISFCTFAYKWAESRIVDAEDQFAKKYQGLHLYGALVPAMRRKAGACLFGLL
jgi:hypothetical protein